MGDLGDAILDAMVVAAPGEHVGHGSGRRPFGVAGCEAELEAVIGQYRVDPVRHGRNRGIEEGRGGDAVGALKQLDEVERAGSVYRDEHVELAPGGLYLHDIDVEEADREGLNRFLAGFSPSRSRSRPMPWHCRQRFKYGMVGCSA
jgi:hypothetical protein